MKNKVDIVNSILINKESIKEVALEHRVRRNVISTIINKSRRDHKFLDELISERNQSIEFRKRVAEYIKLMNNKETFIDSVAST